MSSLPFFLPGAASPLADVVTPPLRVMLPFHGAKTSSLPPLNLSAMFHPAVFSLDLKLKYCEGPEKATRGGEWEPIKITHSNLAYIPNFKIRHTLNPVFSPGKIRRVLSLGKIGQNGQVLSPDKIRLVKSNKTDKFSALVKSDEFSTLVKSTRKTVYLLSGISPNILMGVFEKLPRENDLDHKSLRPLIRWLNSTTGETPATIQSHTRFCFGDKINPAV
jgi:hypothetical protein